MQVELLKAANFTGLYSAAPPAGNDADLSFRDTLDGARETVARNDGDEGASVRAREDAEPREDMPVDEATPEGDEVIGDEQSLGTQTPTDNTLVEVLPVPGEIASTLLPAASGDVSTTATTNIEAPVVVQEALTGKATVSTTQESPGSAQKAATTTTESAVSQVEADAAKTETAPVVPKDNGAVVAQAATHRVGPIATEGAGAGSAGVQAEGSGIAIGQYFKEQGGGATGGDAGREHQFFLLDGADENATTATDKVAEEPRAALDRGATLSATTQFETTSAQLAKTEASVAQAATTPGGDSANVVDGSTAASSTSKAAAEATARATSVLRAEPGDDAGLTRRINRLIRRAVRRGESAVRVRLDPPHLGRVDVEVKLSGERVEVAFQVDDENVRSAILKHLEELQQALEDYGYQTDEVSVDLRQPAEDSNGDSQGREASGIGVDEDDESPLLREAQLEHLGAVMDLRG